MLTLLIPVALGALFLALVERGRGARHAAVMTLLLGGVFIVFSSELLSLTGSLRHGPIAAAWASLAGASVFAAWRGRSRLAAAIAIPPAGRPKRLFLAFAATAVTGILTAAGLSAVRGPPNMTDVMTYHLPRVVFWLQHQSLGFFPTSYYQELSLTPFAELAMLHVYALAGGDGYVQLVQWTAFAGAILAASLLAEALGAGIWGQVAASLACATLPGAALQASGAKPDVVSGFWLLTAAWLALGGGPSKPRLRGAALGVAVGLALLTKGTAYLFAPPVVGALLWARRRAEFPALARAGLAAVLCVIALNAGYWARNYAYNGHPLGDGSAMGDGTFRYANDRFDAGVLASNLLRNASLQLAFRPSWNEAIHDWVVDAHEAMSVHPSAPATTWDGTRYEPAVVSNHEGIVPNTRHVLLLGLTLPWLLWRRRFDALVWFWLGLLAAFVWFCGYLRWQPWHARMHAPLLMLATPLIGVMLERLRPRALLVVAAVWLVWNVRAPLLHNSLRPLAGPQSVFRTDRFRDYFRDWPQLMEPTRRAADYLAAGACRDIGLETSANHFEYPLMARLLDHDPAFRFEHVGVDNGTVRYESRRSFAEPCAVFCLACAEGGRALPGYEKRFGEGVVFDGAVVFPNPPSAAP